MSDFGSYCVIGVAAVEVVWLQPTCDRVDALWREGHSDHDYNKLSP